MRASTTRCATNWPSSPSGDRRRRVEAGHEARAAAEQDAIRKGQGLPGRREGERQNRGRRRRSDRPAISSVRRSCATSPTERAWWTKNNSARCFRSCSSSDPEDAMRAPTPRLWPGRFGVSSDRRRLTRSPRGSRPAPSWSTSTSTPFLRALRRRQGLRHRPRDWRRGLGGIHAIAGDQYRRLRGSPEP